MCMNEQGGGGVRRRHPFFFSGGVRPGIGRVEASARWVPFVSNIG